MKRVAFHTSGCRLNQYETEAVREQFEEEGYVTVRFNQGAEVYVLNTCTVTERAEQECRRLIRRARRQNPSAKIVIMGCYSQLHAEQLKALDGVSAVFGNVEKAALVHHLKELGDGLHVADVRQQRTFEPIKLSNFNRQTRAFLKIQDGCNLVCTFCAVTQARGPNRSRSLNDIVDEAKRLIDNGFQEIVVTGVHIESYGKDIKKIHNLVDVATAIIALEGLQRFRFSSLGPLSLTDELLFLAASHPKICAHFHVPLQSGDDEILKAMKRPYRREWFIERLHKIHELMPEAGIGSDVMVGFPGETDRHFQNTYDLIDKLPFTYLHVFPFSARPGTKAAALPNPILEDAKLHRSKILRQLAQRKKRAFFERFIGREVAVLAENRLDKDGFLTGLTENYIRVAFNGPQSSMNRIVPVQVVQVQKDQVVGSLPII